MMNTYTDEEITSHETLEYIVRIVLGGVLVQERRGVLCRYVECRVPGIH